MMLLSVALMTAAMLVTALLPTHAAVGPAAGWLLLLLRCVMGFSVGGEYTGVVAYLLEGAPERRRGLIASSASAASEVGGAARGRRFRTDGQPVASGANLDNWGWRIPFFVGAALAASCGSPARRCTNRPEFMRQQQPGRCRTAIPPCLAHHRAGIARGFAISALGSITYYVGITYVPAFLTSRRAMTEREPVAVDRRRRRGHRWSRR